MLGLELDAQDLRLGLWQRLLADEEIPVADVDEDLLPLAREGVASERLAFILLRTCVAATVEMTPAMRRNLKAALIHWFSQTGSPSPETPCEFPSRADLAAIVGRRLTWAESAKLVGGNPQDYSAYQRLVARLQTAVQEQWHAVFGSECPFAAEENR